LRALARGVYPPVLTDRGVPDALRSVAMLVPLPVHLIEGGVRRHPIEIESAAYFTCVEAVQNALKHAHGATGIWIKLGQAPRWLHFEVRDNGPGFQTDGAHGRGLRNMRDRIEAVGGQVSIESEPGHGTRVTGTIPLRQSGCTSTGQKPRPPDPAARATARGAFARAGRDSILAGGTRGKERRKARGWGMANTGPVEHS